MKRKINIWLVGLLAFVLGVFVVFSIFAYMAVEEGCNSGFLYAVGSLMYVFRFPSHNLLWEYMNSGSGSRFSVIFGFGLFFNTVIYAFALERVYSLVTHRKLKKVNG